MCPVEGTGQATFTNGATTATITSGTGLSGTNRLLVVIGARPDGSPWYTTYTWTSGTTITLPYQFQGTTGTYDWQIVTKDAGGMDYLSFRNTAVADWFDDPDVGRIYSCTYNSSTQITLDRVWTGTAPAGQTITGTLQGARANVIGTGTQPFFNGVDTRKNTWAVATGNTDYATLRTNVAEWLQTDGYQASTNGWYYAAGMPACTPQWDALLNCSYNPSSDFNTGESRTLGAEMTEAFRAYYEANPIQARKDRGDAAYGGIWGSSLYNTGGVYYDSITGIDANGISLTAGYKWYGFFAGFGGMHIWPAARLGGASPENLRTIAVSSRLADVSGAVSIKITATRPNGTTSTATCTTGACSVTVDARQGTQWLLTIEYYDGASGTGKRLALGTQEASL
jgi:hypothetical protein